MITFYFSKVWKRFYSLLNFKLYSYGILSSLIVFENLIQLFTLCSTHCLILETKLKYLFKSFEFIRNLLWLVSYLIYLTHNFFDFDRNIPWIGLWIEGSLSIGFEWYQDVLIYLEYWNQQIIIVISLRNKSKKDGGEMGPWGDPSALGVEGRRSLIDRHCNQALWLAQRARPW